MTPTSSGWHAAVLLAGSGTATALATSPTTRCPSSDTWHSKLSRRTTAGPSILYISSFSTSW
ncbi:hypothetical protein PR001_g10105 [Phytophthora rubi]|uniref:RxLR effector protein n=1 Tax=Phytophthora rubi TaxID=129364 RepID=A0A6A3MBE5_9STRA|nr:hypothetical protein PR002_g10118 [Phytophthora rubi]KAE9033576.1 hypothetical protein PR001_g10105 [Phytophthora rubi]